MEWKEYISEKLAGKFFIRYAILGLLLTFWVLKHEGEKICYSLRKEKRQMFWQTLNWFLFFALIHFSLKSILSWMFSSSLPNIKSEKINTQKNIITNSQGKWGQLAQIFLGMCILAPLVEEGIFRYFIFRIFGRKNPLSYFFSFFTFILAHYHRGENILLLFSQYSVATIAFIYIYQKSGWKLFSPILLHSLVNFLFIVLVLINPACSLV